MPQAEKYEYIRATIQYGNLLTVKYKFVGLPEAVMEHDDELELVAEASVRALVRNMLGVDAADPVIVEVTYL